MKNRVFPPMHDHRGRCIPKGKLIDSSFDCYYINLATAGELSDIGRLV